MSSICKRFRAVAMSQLKYPASQRMAENGRRPFWTSAGRCYRRMQISAASRADVDRYRNGVRHSNDNWVIT